MIDIIDRATLCAWLEGRNEADELIVASRIACRKLPRLVSAVVGDPSVKTRQKVVLPVFRCIAAVVTSAVQSDFHAEIRPHLPSIANAANEAYQTCAAIDAANTDHQTAFSVGAADTATAAFEAAKVAIGSFGSAHYAAAADIEEFWRAIRHDARLIEQGEQAFQFGGRCLWPDPIGLHGTPDELLTKWFQLRDYLSQVNDDWQVWIGWYQDRLDGKPINKLQELKKILLPSNTTAQGTIKLDTKNSGDVHVGRAPGHSDGPATACAGGLSNISDFEGETDVRKRAGFQAAQAIKNNPVTIGFQLSDLLGRVSQEIALRKEERRNDPYAVRNIALLENIEISLNELSSATFELATEEAPRSSEAVKKRAWTVRDQLEEYSGWIAGDENARAIANGVLFSGMAGVLIQVVGMSALPVTVFAVTAMAGEKFNNKIADLIKRMKGG
ncbi:hypothetical protein KX928_04745 [Roseobacter sp. YSTF-M11]|uniref:Uncharacterized protein n=1 Tax=Roseobacter insulae TaxID=2859783 RepID=A0A9X1FSS6_9RHOB|nr:hypothetical protein [Roseobacter insulae]MBW4707091.1 hypothetical protein [Roseobacter insulae]